MYDLTWLMMVLRVGTEDSVVNLIGRKYQSMIAAIVLSVLHAVLHFEDDRIVGSFKIIARRKLRMCWHCNEKDLRILKDMGIHWTLFRYPNGFGYRQFCL